METNLSVKGQFLGVKFEARGVKFDAHEAMFDVLEAKPGGAKLLSLESYGGKVSAAELDARRAKFEGP